MLCLQYMYIHVCSDWGIEESSIPTKQANLLIRLLAFVVDPYSEVILWESPGFKLFTVLCRTTIQDGVRKFPSPSAIYKTTDILLRQPSDMTVTNLGYPVSSVVVDSV